MILTMFYVLDSPAGPREVIACERHRALAADALEWAGLTLDVHELSAPNNARCDFADRGGCA
jgi:hypothetical protein